MNNFEKIYNIDTSFLQEKVKKFSKEKWNEFDYRQKTFDVHKNTRTIPLIFNKDLNNLNTPNEYDDFVDFSGELLNLYNIFLNHYKKGSILRALLVKLNAKSEISKHIDNGIGLEKSKRHHIPIITNSKVLFTVDVETIHMKQGEIWHIDNSNKYHSVLNNSKKDRVHLIVDWLINE